MESHGTMQQNKKANVQKQQTNQALRRKKMQVLPQCLFVKLLSVDVYIPCKHYPDLKAEHNTSQILQTPY